MTEVFKLFWTNYRNVSAQRKTVVYCWLVCVSYETSNKVMSTISCEIAWPFSGVQSAVTTSVRTKTTKRFNCIFDCW